MPIEIDGLPIKNGDFPIKNGGLPFLKMVIFPNQMGLMLAGLVMTFTGLAMVKPWP